MSPRTQRAAAPSAKDMHRAWLVPVETDGPFLSVPALTKAWPQGMPLLPGAAKAALRRSRPDFETTWDDWDGHRDDDAVLARYRDVRDAWVEAVLRDVLGWSDDYHPGPGTAPSITFPDRSVTATARGRLADGDQVGALVLVVDPVDSLHVSTGDGWSASPVDRVEELLRRSGVPIGVVTDGRWWAVVSARKDTVVASGVVDALRWVAEPTVIAAFAELLGHRALIGRTGAARLTDVFADSVAAAEDITVALGTQVRRAVELLVAAFSETAVDARREGAPDPLPAKRGEVYDAAVTVMMRTVFLLFAEERSLLPQGRLFSAAYGVSGELVRLRQRYDDESAEALDGTSSTWHRLLATSRGLYDGATFEDLRLPAYGGSLFDAARFPFLTARTSGARSTLAVSVSDRVMLEVLQALQVAVVKGEARQISFREIDVEQIGYIYEGLLGYTCQEVEEVTVGLIGKLGAEPEMALTTLEALDARFADTGRLADEIRTVVGDGQPGATPATKARLKKSLDNASTDDADQALRAVTDDADLRERLRPFAGIIRRDLRNRPVVVAPGGLVVVETPSRATAGAHYTPRALAEEVVEHALKPLLYSVGPHQTPDETRWVPISSDEILDLDVADIACGSGAFLVAAARYLAGYLVEAWHREGVGGGDPHEVQVRAIRKVVARCLYGADINAMAVEMCKLSLWLVSLDPRLPFSFVDDKVLHGNSLLGLTDVRQIKSLNIDPSAQRPVTLFSDDLDTVMGKAIRLRRDLASEVVADDPQRSTTTKARLLRELEHLVTPASELADAVIAAGLRFGGKPGRPLKAAYENLAIAISNAYGPERDRAMLDGILAAGLNPTVPTDYERWKPLHWVLAVPDVMEGGGFNAVIGNPPFLGGKKLTGALGTETRDWFVHTLADGQKGSADLVAYFFLRAASLLKPHGALGLIATNSIAQGDTREVGLGRLIADGMTITRAVQSRSWPAASANLDYAAVWATFTPVDSMVRRVCDDVAVSEISSLLEAAGRVKGSPVRLAENVGMSFIGCYVLGMGFVLEPEEATLWIKMDPRNAEVVRPYLNGEDLNSRPDASPSRWVIDFNTRTREQAETYRLPMTRIQATVRPERQKVNRKALRERWWQYADKRPKMRKTIAALDEVLVIARVSKTVTPLRITSRDVMSEAVVVFATENTADQAVLSSNLHQTWAIVYGSTLETRVRYTPSDVFETFPRPGPTDDLARVGKILDTERREMMLRRDLGLTKLYNLVNDPDVTDASDLDVARLRAIHVELDHAVMDAYGWSDVPLEHGFHTYRQMQRWTVCPAARVEILDRLLEENHQRAALQGSAPPPAEADDESDNDLEVQP